MRFRLIHVVLKTLVDNMPKQLIVYECHYCYALLPYPGCRHGCLQDEEGFFEEEEYMLTFATHISTIPHHLLLIIRAPDEEEQQ